MSDGIKEKWIVVHPESFLHCLELVAAGHSPQEVMFTVLDLAEQATEDEE